MHEILLTTERHLISPGRAKGSSPLNINVGQAVWWGKAAILAVPEQDERSSAKA